MSIERKQFAIFFNYEDVHFLLNSNSKKVHIKSTRFNTSQERILGKPERVAVVSIIYIVLFAQVHCPNGHGLDCLYHFMSIFII